MVCSYIWVIKLIGKCILSQSRNFKFKNFFERAPNHGGGPSSPLKYTLGLCTFLDFFHSLCFIFDYLRYLFRSTCVSFYVYILGDFWYLLVFSHKNDSPYKHSVHFLQYYCFWCWTVLTQNESHLLDNSTISFLTWKVLYITLHTSNYFHSLWFFLYIEQKNISLLTFALFFTTIL